MAAARVPCQLSYTLHGKCALPRKALKSRSKRCLEASRRSIGTHDIDPTSDIHYHVSADGLPYFTKGQYITTGNLLDPTVCLAFDKAVSMIEKCLVSHGVPLNRYEITIILRCVSLRRLKFRYYMIDHDNKRVGWIHGGSIRVEDEHAPTDKWVGYWEHMAFFPTHRLCTPREYHNALSHLDAMRAANLDPTLVRLDDATIVNLSNMLRRFDPTAIDQHTTASVAKTFQKIYERTVAEHRTSLVPRKAVGAMKSLYGAFSMFTSWAHHRDHKEENVSEQQHPSNHNTPDTSPRSSAFEPHGPGRSTTEDSWQSGLHYRAGRQAGGGA